MKHLVQENKNLKFAVLIHVPLPALLRKPETGGGSHPGIRELGLETYSLRLPGQTVPIELQLSFLMCKMTNPG